MNRIVDMCPLTKFDGGLTRLHKVDDDAANWRNNVATCDDSIHETNNFVCCQLV